MIWSLFLICLLHVPFSSEQIQLTDVRYLVVDEADTMLDQSFQEATTSIIKTIKVKRQGVEEGQSGSGRNLSYPICAVYVCVSPIRVLHLVCCRVTSSNKHSLQASTSKPPTSHHMPSLSSAKGVHVIAVAATLSTQLLKKFQSLVPVSPFIAYTCSGAPSRHLLHLIDSNTAIGVCINSLQDVKVVTTKSLHRILPHIEQRFYKVTQAEKAGEVHCINASLHHCTQ